MSAISDAIATLTAKVTAQETVNDSAVALLQGLKTELDAAIASAASSGADVAALTSLSAQIDTDTQKLSTAVAANTPAAQAPPAT